jgi:hypothetical protein
VIHSPAHKRPPQQIRGRGHVTIRHLVVHAPTPTDAWKKQAAPQKTGFSTSRSDISPEDPLADVRWTVGTNSVRRLRRGSCSVNRRWLPRDRNEAT